MFKGFLSPYNHKNQEKIIHALWEKNNLFNLSEKDVKDKTRETFTVLMPPPNVTGILHLGHSLEHALMDVRVRYERMRGKRVLFVPGADHAAIATQARVEKDITEKEKIKNPREHYGRERLLEKIKAYADDAKKESIEQVKASGVSCDWSRFKYTLDDDITDTVISVFKKMYEDGLIYRGRRIVNWDPKLQTTISDDEIIREETNTPFYYLNYGPFLIGTARPETKFGDKYVVMHPEDERYKGYQHRQEIEVDWINGKVVATIIKDEAVDMDFGTGVMTITPWHDAVDFEIAQRHGLEMNQIIDWKGKLLGIAGDLKGIHIKKARGLLVEKLKEKGLVDRIDENYKNALAKSERSGEIVEPQIKTQWFIDVKRKVPNLDKSLNDIQREVFKEKGDLNINLYPDYFKKVYYEWVDNPKDWCISRQIWWGHRIPIWYRGEEIFCGKKPEGKGWIQDEDTLDTWFSSGTWAFSTLGVVDVDNTDVELRDFYPVNFMQMGYEILFLWMARMILMGVYVLGDVPFKTVFIHGLVRDKTGKKFSKSLRNTIDIREVIDKYGADALRFGLLVGVTAGNDVRFDEEKIKHSKHFINKLWNISRFILSNVEKLDIEKFNEEKDLLKEAKVVQKKVGQYLEECKYNLAIEVVYSYVWHRLADKIIEESKPILSGGDLQKRGDRAKTLKKILIIILKTLHPFLPFVTETIWQHMDDKNFLTRLFSKKKERFLSTSKL